jgi:hypothetical protein
VRGLAARAHAGEPHADAREPPGAQRRERHALRAPRGRADRVDRRPALDAQVGPVPAQRLEPHQEAQLAVDAEQRLRDLQRRVGAVGMVGVEAAADPHRRRAREVLALEAQDLEQLGHHPPPHEVPLEPVHRRQRAVGALGHAVQELVDAIEEQLAVVGVRALERVDVVAEVVGDDARVVPAARAPRALARQVVADVLARLEAVEQRLALDAPLRDRQVPALADPVEVDRLLDHVDGARREVRRQDHRDVLVVAADREAPAVLLPERALEQLVPGRAVGDQRAVARDVRLHPRLRERTREEARLRGAGRGQAVDVAGREVRAGLVERADEQLVGARRDDVVGVHEGDELAAGVLDAGVARGAQAAVLLAYDPEARVARGELLGERRAGVGRAVVDEDRLEVAVGLPGERVQAGRQVALDVVDGDDDADPRRHRGPHCDRCSDCTARRIMRR